MIPTVIPTVVPTEVRDVDRVVDRDIVTEPEDSILSGVVETEEDEENVLLHGREGEDSHENIHVIDQEAATNTLLSSLFGGTQQHFGALTELQEDLQKLIASDTDQTSSIKIKQAHCIGRKIESSVQPC